MVRSLRVLGVAAAIMTSAVSAFTPATPLAAHQSRPLSPSPLQATSAAVDAPPAFGSGLVLDRPPTIEKQEQEKKHNTNRDMDSMGEWILRIYNDNINTREYVAVCLVEVVGLCESRAYYTMQDAHRNGIAKVGEYNQEVAECYEEQLIERGIVCDVVPEEYC